MNLKTKQMKHFIITFGLLLFSYTVTSQDKNIETKSIELDNLINFIVEQIDRKTEASEAPLDNIIFLLETPLNDLITEDKVILNQAFKLVSKRLTEDDYISILTYTGFNGIALNQTSPKDLKAILYTIDNLKLSVKEFHDDGIALAYQFANENFMEEAVNTVILIRNPNAANGEQVTVENTKAPKVKNNVVLITAMALLPELISVIKD